MFVAQSSTGHFEQATLNSPFASKVGDQAVVSGSTVTFIRNGAVVGTRTISAASVVVSGSDSIQSIDKVMFFRSVKMPGIQATLTGAVRNNQTGTVRFRFADGSEREFSNFASIASEVEYLDSEVSTAQDALILKTIRRSPDGANLENCVGAQCSIDMNANEELILTIGVE